MTIKVKPPLSIPIDATPAQIAQLQVDLAVVPNAVTTAGAAAAALPVASAVVAAIPPTTLGTISGNLSGTRVTGLPGNLDLLTWAATVQAFMQAGGSIPTVTTPTIAGTLTVGSTLTATPGTVSTTGGHGSSYTLQWNRENPSNPRSAIPNATNTTYILSAADLGFFITVSQVPKDTVTGAIGLPATSAITAIITGTTPVNTLAPAITPSGSQLSTQLLTMSSGTWTNGSTYTYLFYDNGVAIGTRSTVNTITPGAARVGHIITGDVISTSTLGVVAAAVAASNSITVTGVAPTIVNTAVPTLTGATSGGGVGIIQAKAVDTAGAATSLNNVLPQTVASGNFRMELVAITSHNVLSSEVASPGAVGWSQFSVTDGTGGAFPNTIQAWHPAAYTNLDTSVLSSFASANAIKFFLESDIIDGSFGLLAGIIGQSSSNPTFTWTTPAITGLTGDLVLVECVYSGGGSNLGFTNGGDATRIALTGTNISSGHHSNTVDGDDMYVQYRTIIGATAGQSFTGTGAFPGSGGGGESSYAMILAFRKKAGGAGNNIQKGLTYNINPGTWTSNGSPITPTSRSWDFYLNGVHPAGYSNASATYTVDTTAQVGNTFTMVEQAVIGGVTYPTSLTGATSYTVIANATFTAVVDFPNLTFTSGTAISSVVPVRFINGTAPYTITTNPALPGLSINASTGAITGTAGAVGVYTIAINGQDAAAATASGTITITIQSAVTIPIYAGIDATKPFATQGGSLQFGGAQYPNVSSIADTIGGGFTGGVSVAVNGSTSRFGKFLDPLGSGKTCIRLAIAASDPTFENDTAGLTRRCDVYEPVFYNDGDVMWATGRIMFPAAVYNYNGSFGVQLMEIHGGTDGNGFYLSLRGLNGQKLTFIVVRTSSGSYDTHDISAFAAADTWMDVTVRQKYDSTGAACSNSIWINGVQAYTDTALNWIAGQGGSYPKVPWYNGNATVQAGGSYGYIQKVLYFKDNSQQYTEPQIRAMLG